VHHTHFVWFGLPFSVPAPEEAPGDQPDNSSQIFVAKTADSALTNTLSSICAALELWNAGHPALIARDSPNHRYSAKTCATNWLCDTARHERSGVQLA
jgi:hypothetical protein